MELAPGRNAIACNIDNHYAVGMYAPVVAN